MTAVDFSCGTALISYQKKNTFHLCVFLDTVRNRPFSVLIETEIVAYKDILRYNANQIGRKHLLQKFLFELFLNISVFNRSSTNSSLFELLTGWGF